MQFFYYFIGIKIAFLQGIRKLLWMIEYISPFCFKSDTGEKHYFFKKYKKLYVT